jgi:acetyl-CoA C-acetyltransferase
LWDHRSEHPWGFELMSRVANDAWAEAGIGPEDVDLFEVHDAFTIGEIVTVEALGLAPLGEGGRLAAEHVTTLDGPSPVNPSGGLLSRGHPHGATGLAQVAEIVWQLRGPAGARPVDDARHGDGETMGGGTAGIDGNGCVVAVLECP